MALPYLGPRRPPARCRRRGETGLASHEWLLLIAAVASFTALAVFVLAETLDDSVSRAGADDSARLASARRDARLIENEAVAIVPDTWPLRLWGQWEDHFRRRCSNIENAYRSHGFTVTTEVDGEESHPPFNRPSDEVDETGEMITAHGRFADGVAEALAKADQAAPQTGKPQVLCEVSAPS